jgi:pilus assembly protein Flp/PilA
MLAAYSAWERLSTDRKGVASFEYVIVTAAIVAAVATVFNTSAANVIGTALTNALSAIIATVAAVGGG